MVDAVEGTSVVVVTSTVEKSSAPSVKPVSSSKSSEITCAYLPSNKTFAENFGESLESMLYHLIHNFDKIMPYLKLPKTLSYSYWSYSVSIEYGLNSNGDSILNITSDLFFTANGKILTAQCALL